MISTPAVVRTLSLPQLNDSIENIALITCFCRLNLRYIFIPLLCSCITAEIVCASPVKPVFTIWWGPLHTLGAKAVQNAVFLQPILMVDLQQTWAPVRLVQLVASLRLVDGSCEPRSPPKCPVPLALLCSGLERDLLCQLFLPVLRKQRVGHDCSALSLRRHQHRLLERPGRAHGRTLSVGQKVRLGLVSLLHFVTDKSSLCALVSSGQ